MSDVQFEDGTCVMCGLPAVQGRVYDGWANSGPGHRHIIHADPDTECGPPLRPAPLPPVRLLDDPPAWPDDPDLTELRRRFDEGT